MRFLIDECLTIDLISIASQAGHEAQHVAHVGKAGWKDWNVARHAAAGDFVLVTNTTAPVSSIRYHHEKCTGQHGDASKCRQGVLA
jgi:predicted nuclease of predicted toxin-antitoxin system